MLQIC